MNGLRALLLAVVVFVHGPALGGGFVFDDVLSVTENPHIESLWPPWRAAWAEHESPLAARPLPALSLAVDHAIGGRSPRVYKATNLAIFAAAVLALFSAVRATLALPRAAAHFDARQGALLAFASALLWAVHPLVTEPVHYITQRTESWMALFYLLTLGCTARAFGSAHPRRWRAAAVACCASGMASKEVMVTAPIAVVLLECVYAGVPLGRLFREHRGFHAALAACWLVLAALMAANFRSDTVGFTHDVDALTYLWNQAWVVARYLRLAVWPVGLSIDWGVPRPIGIADVWPSLSVVAALLAAATWLLVRRPLVGVPVCLGLLVLLPTSSVVPIVTEVGAERRVLLPLAFWIAAAVCGGAAVLHTPRARRVGAAAVGALAVALGVISFSRHAEFRDERALWRAAVAAFPDNARAFVNVGREEMERGDLAAGIDALLRALALDPRSAEAHSQLGIARAREGRAELARQHFERAIVLEPGYARAHYNLALLQAAAGEPQAARASLRRALALEPRYAKAAAQLAWLLATDPDPRKRRPEEALALARHAAALEPQDAAILDVLAAATAAAGDFEGAVGLARRARARALASGRFAQHAAIGRRLARYRSGEPWEETPGARSSALPGGGAEDRPREP